MKAFPSNNPEPRAAPLPMKSEAPAGVPEPGRSPPRTRACDLQPVILAIPPTATPRTAQQVLQQREYARRTLRYCAKRCGAPAEGWEQDAAHVPLPNAGYFWSVSHKRHWAAAVIADRPVGIDIEHLSPRPRKLHDALADAEEWGIIGDKSWHSFFRLWTAKEAVLKACAVGIAGLSKCRLVDVRDELHMTLAYNREPWCIEHHEHAGHITAVTCNTARVKWHVIEKAQENVKTSKRRKVRPSDS